LRTLTRVPRFCVALGLLSLVAAVGCGTGGAPVLSHTTGHFSDTTLTGSYVYEIHGMALNNVGTFVPYREIGVFTADGNGHITAGTDDSSLGASGTAITGTYSVVSDGTGSINLNTSSLGIPISLAITVVSSSQVQLMEADTVLNAGGTAELQDSSAAGTSPTGTFVFRLHQEQSAQNSAIGASQVGAFALSGGAGTGAMDQDLNGALTSPNVNVSLNAPSSGRGTGTLMEMNTTTSFTTDFVYYIVNSNRMALLVSNGGAVGAGSAEAQSGVSSGTGLSGSYAFGSRGDDLSTGVDGVATVGQFTASSGSISGKEDVMQDGNYTANASSASTCYGASSAGGMNGRVVVTNGSGSPCSGTITQVFWMVSPSRAFFLNNTGTTLEDGTADLQTTGSFSASVLKGQFAMAMDGVDLIDGQLLSRVGALQFDGSSGLALTELANGSNSGTVPSAQTGTYSVSSNGRVVGNLTRNSNGGPPLDLVMYAVSGSQAYALQQDPGLITSGTIALQQ
jgi:hypothetical protein